MVGEVGVEPTMLPIRTRFTVWGCTRHSINSPVLLAEDKGIEPSTFRWRSFQDCVSTIDAILHILGACHGNRTHAYWSARPARKRCSVPRLRYLHKQIITSRTLWDDQSLTDSNRLQVLANFYLPRPEL